MLKGISDKDKCMLVLQRLGVFYLLAGNTIVVLGDADEDSDGICIASEDGERTEITVHKTGYESCLDIQFDGDGNFVRLEL